MNLGLAAPAGLAAALLAAPLVVFYVLKVRRPRTTVASTYLWERTERSVAAAVPWQRFRPDATFWLVLAAVVAGALALARPYLAVTARLGDHTIVVVDASASMLADEDGPSRLELARRAASGLVERLAPGQTVSVVEAGGRARVLVSSSSEPGRALRALAAVRPSHAPADLAGAFTLVAALTRPGEETVVHLFSDGEVPPEAREVAPDGLVVTAVGADRGNVAVSRLQAVPAGAGSSQVFVQVRNFGQLPTRARLILLVGGEEQVHQDLRVAPRATRDAVLTVRGAAGDVLEARVASSRPDALALDDSAWAVLATPRDLQVLVAGPGNVFLEAAFASVPGVTVRTAASVPADTSGLDLLVVDRVAAPATPRVATLYVAPPVGPAGISVAGEVDRPALAFQAPGHPLLAAVDLSEVAVAAAQRVEAPALQTVAGGPDLPLVLAGRLEAVPVVYVAFDLLESNLPLLTAWPVLAANAASWLAGPPASHPATAGATVALPAPSTARTLTVTPPSGVPRRVDAVAPRVLVDEVGLWRVRPDTSAAEEVVAVNAAPTEGDLARPRPDPDATDSAAGGSPAAGRVAEGRRSIAAELTVVVLALVVAEWLWATLLAPRWARRRTPRTARAAGRPAGRA